MEDSLDGTAGTPVPELLPDESPRTIFEIMTCHFIPGGYLLSPLTGNVLELREKPKPMIKHQTHELHDDEVEFLRDRGHTTSATLDIKDKSAKEIKSDEKKDRVSSFKSSKCRVSKTSALNKGTKPLLQDVSDDIGSNFLSTIIKTEHSVKESEKFTGEATDQMQGSKKGPFKGHINDKKKDSNEEPSLYQGFPCKVSYDSEEYNNQPLTSSSRLENIPKVVHVKEELSQYKCKEMGSLISAKSMDIMEGNVDRNSSGLIKGKKKNVSSSQAALSGKKLKFKARKQLNEDRDKNSYGEDEDYALDHRIDLANSYPKDKSVKLEKNTILSGGTGNKSGVGNGGDLKISPLFDNKSDPLPLVYRNGATESSTALTAPAPIVINEQWVCCDKCENWRLLPYGMNPDVLPKKWLCSMQSWLPGMNSCKITEDETTRALRALYMIPAPENNINDGGHDNGMLGIGAATAPSSKGNMQSISTLGKLKGSYDVDVANTFDLADMSKPSKKPHAPSSRKPDGVDCFLKLKEKWKIAELSDKGEIVEKGQSHTTRSVGVDHDNLRASKKMKKETTGPVMRHQSFEFGINKSSPPANVTPKSMKKRSGILPGMKKYGSSSSGKHCHGADKIISDGVIKMSDTENSGRPDSSIKKRKLKQRQSNEHDLGLGHRSTGTNANQNIIETNVLKKKPRPELKLSKTDRTATHSRGTVAGTDDDRITVDKEYLSEQHQENTHFQHPLLSGSSTRRNVCHAQTSAAATSSSSKVSDSHKCKADFQEMRASPVESVSSSPLRTSDKNPLDRQRSYSQAVAENVHPQVSGKKRASSVAETCILTCIPKRKYDLGSDSDQAKAQVSGLFNGDTVDHVQNDRDLLKDKQDLTNVCLINKGSGLSIRNAKLNPEHKIIPDTLSLHDNRDHKQPTGQQNGKTPPHFDSNRSDHAVISYGNIKPDKGNIPHNDQKINPFTVKGSKHHQSSLNNASNGDASFKAKQIGKSVNKKLETRKQVTIGGDASNLTNASVLMKEARSLKHLSKRLKGKVDDFESTSMCFEAGLKFLHVASLSEVESPSSSASDIDNLNSQSTVAKAVSARGVYSPQIAGNPISRNNQHLMGLLSYADDINNAFEGTRKSQNSFSAYLSGIGKNKSINHESVE
nr:unnamed protein product [Digitaria exilis]